MCKEAFFETAAAGRQRGKRIGFGIEPGNKDFHGKNSGTNLITVGRADVPCSSISGAASSGNWIAILSILIVSAPDRS
jgi:hypothetical protein